MLKLFLAAKKARKQRDDTQDVEAAARALGDELSGLDHPPVGIPNPYLNGRRAWNDHVGHVISQRNVAYMVASFCGLIAIMAVGGLIHAAMEPKFTPYAVEVDRLGNSAAVGPSVRVELPNPRTTRSGIAKWIESARLVTVDGSLQRRAVFAVYGNLAEGDPARAKMDEWYQQSDPRERAKTELIWPEIDSVLPLSENSWQVEWTEIVRDRNGNQKNRSNWRAVVTVYSVEPTNATTEEEIRRNPIGLYVKDFAWSRVK
jgi:type IV secretion system protein TrbF